MSAEDYEYFMRSLNYIPSQYYFFKKETLDEEPTTKKRKAMDDRISKKAKFDPAAKKTTQEMFSEQQHQSCTKEERNSSMSIQELKQKLEDKIQKIQQRRKPISREAIMERRNVKNHKNKVKPVKKLDQVKEEKAIPVKENGDVMFSKFELAGKKTKKAKPSESKVAALEKKKKLLKEMEPVKAQEIMRKDEFHKAMDRIKGEKVLDDPELMKKSLNREKKKKAKSAKNWNERIEKVQSQIHNRQKKRQENIENRKKKNRPGFEGSMRSKKK